jgi:hypothetical protein
MMSIRNKFSHERSFGVRSRSSSDIMTLGLMAIALGGAAALGGLVIDSIAPGAGEVVTVMGVGAVAVGASVVGIDKITQ